MMTHKSNSGFTIIELMIATAIFSLVLLISTTSLLVIGRQFHKASIQIPTQETSRTIIQDVAREIQFSRRVPVVVANAICIGSVRYTIALDTQVEDTPSGPNQGYHGLWKDTNTSSTCSQNPSMSNANPGNNGRELLALHTRLKDFSIAQALPTSDYLWNIDLSIIYGDNEVIDRSLPLKNQNCYSSSAGGAFCGLSELHTSVVRGGK